MVLQYIIADICMHIFKTHRNSTDTMDTPLEPKISLTSGHAKVINRKDQHVEDKQMVITEPLNHFNTCTLAN